MSIKTSIVIFFITFMTIIVEFVVYTIILGIRLSSPGGINSMAVLAMSLVLLMIFTATVGILTPISAFIEHITKKRHISYRILFFGTALIMILIMILLNGCTNVRSVSYDNKQRGVSTTLEFPAR